ncbi:hypothetical protein Bca101_082718 [Brassica carinata]
MQRRDTRDGLGQVCKNNKPNRKQSPTHTSTKVNETMQINIHDTCHYEKKRVYDLESDVAGAGVRELYFIIIDIFFSMSIIFILQQ